MIYRSWELNKKKVLDRRKKEWQKGKEREESKFKGRSVRERKMVREKEERVEGRKDVCKRLKGDGREEATTGRKKRWIKGKKGI